MSFSELHQMAKGKLDSIHPKMTNCSTNLSIVPDHEFVELVWENGQLLMQGQSSRTPKSTPCTDFSHHTFKAQEKDGGDTILPKIGRSRTMDSLLNDISSGPSGLMGLGQDADMVSWLNYPLDDSLERDYSSEFFSELSGVNLNALSAQNTTLPIHKNSNYGQIVRDSHMVPVHGCGNPEQGNASKVVGEGPEPTRPRISQLYSSSLHQCRTPVRSRVSDFNSSNTNNGRQAACGDSSQTPNLTGGSPSMKMQKQDLGPTRLPLQPTNKTGLMNFSHFSRPAALAKANHQSIGAVASPGLSNINRLRCNEKVSAAGSSILRESTLINSSGGSRSVTGFQSQPVSVPTKVDIKPSVAEPPKEPVSAEQSQAICREDAIRNNRSPDQLIGRTSSFAASIVIGKPDSEKAIEQVAASSSVCSGNSAGGDSSDPKDTLKRKSRETEESEYLSEDVEEESVDVRKPAPARGGMSAKRSRAAEVHNLSERRRRDRINEKMRALQELIPNCNKVDKASMLDEAIEYLKTLQLQVQMMSMGSGLCMPPMMFPTGMQHINASHMPHFLPMRVGMGMGMGMGVGFGMGMLDMSDGSSGCPLIQVPPMHGAQFPGLPISGPTNLPGRAGFSHQMFGFPGQGLPMPMPNAPFSPLSGGPTTKSVLVPNVSGAAAPVEVPNSAPPSSSNDPIQNINPPSINMTSANCSQNQTSTQCQASKEGFEQSALVQRNDQTPR